MKKFFIILLLTSLLPLSGCLWSNRFDQNMEMERLSLSDTKDLDSDTNLEEKNVLDEEKNISDESSPKKEEAEAKEDNKEGIVISNEETEILKEVIEKMKEENDALKEVIKSMQNVPLSSQDIQNRGKKTQMSFKSCGIFSTYKTQEWMNKLSNLLEKQKLILYGQNDPIFITETDISSACYSENGDIFIFIVQNEEKRSFNIFRYDIKHNTISSPNIISHENNLIPPSTFGKREGNIINLAASSKKDTCNYNIDYKYDFLKNELSLQKVCTKCPSKNEECSSYQ